MMKDFAIVLFLLIYSGFKAQERMLDSTLPPMIINTDSVIFTLPDVAPSFKGGIEFMSAYIQRKIQEKEDSNAKCILRITGTAYINFIVEINGALSHIKLLKGISNCSACNNLALKIVREMPAWIPAYYQYEPVRSSYTIPVKFKDY